MSSFYVNKLIKAEAESFLKRFFLDYPILYIYIYIYIYIYKCTPWFYLIFVFFVKRFPNY